MAKNNHRFHTVGLVLQGLLYIAAGANHFLNTDMYVHIMPPHYTNPLFWVQLTGVLEVLGGIGLILPFVRPLAAWGLVLMLLAYFDVHITMATHPQWYPEIPAWLLYVRIPLQFVLIAWAWHYTAAPEPSRNPDDGGLLADPYTEESNFRRSLRRRRQAIGVAVRPMRNKPLPTTAFRTPPTGPSGVHGVRNWRFPRRRATDYPVTPPAATDL